MMASRFFAGTGAWFSALAISAGAFGAHALKSRITSDALDIFEIGVRYQMYHAFGIFLVAWLCFAHPDTKPERSGWLFIAGIVLFPGSLYALSLTGIHWLGAVTPLGGICFVAGWVWLGWSLLRTPRTGNRNEKGKA